VSGQAMLLLTLRAWRTQVICDHDPHVHTDPRAALKSLVSSGGVATQCNHSFTGLFPFTEAFRHTSKAHPLIWFQSGLGDILNVHNMFAMILQAILN